MQILNSEDYSTEDKRRIYDEYMNNLKKNRKSAIVEKLNEYAKDIPVITKEIYISKLKEYENDDLSKPFEVIEEELLGFENEMKNKYNEYLKSQEVVEPEVEEIIPDVAAEEQEENFDDTIFNEPILNIEQEEEEVKPSLLITDEISVLNEAPSETDKSILAPSDANTKEIIPDANEKEKGNASAIILSIIAVIIGIVVMYTIIKLN